MRTTSEPTYALQLVRPFWSLLRRYPQVPEALWKVGQDAPDEQRFSVVEGQRFLDQVVQMTGEPDIGLLAAQETAFGGFDALEFVAVSAPTRLSAIECVFRYIRVMNEAAAFRVEVDGPEARIVLGSSVPLTRAGIDFQSGALHLATARWFSDLPEDLQVYLTYPEPRDTRRHREVFGKAKLRFGAPFDGFVFSASALRRQMRGADAAVHQVLRSHLDRLLSELAPGDDLVAQLRATLLGSLKDGPPTAEALAEGMGISRRTLTRRLSQASTSYSELLADVRHAAALRYLEQTDHSIDDVAFLLGFSESSAFVRAFQRWQGSPPATYRRKLRTG